MGITNLGNFNAITGQDNVFTGNNTFTGLNTFTNVTSFTGRTELSGEVLVPPPVYTDNPITLDFFSNTGNCKFGAYTITANQTGFTDFEFTQIAFDYTKYESTGLEATFDLATSTWTLAPHRVYVINAQVLFRTIQSYGFTSAAAIGVYIDEGTGGSWLFFDGSFDGYAWPYSSTTFCLLQPQATAIYATGEKVGVKMALFAELAHGIDFLVGGDSTGTSNNRMIIQEYYQNT